MEGFYTSPSGQVELRFSGTETIEVRDEIYWIHLLQGDDRDTANKQLTSGGPYDQYMDRLWERLRGYCNKSSETELAFFDLYCHLCWQSDGPVELTPALIPNVTVNWYTKQTARRESNEPFHVDFVIKTPRVAGDCLAVIEVDGPSHYADFNNGRYQVSEEAYARHLRRDKFLRDSGFKVFRIANIEVMRIM